MQAEGRAAHSAAAHAAPYTAAHAAPYTAGHAAPSALYSSASGAPPSCHTHLEDVVALEVTQVRLAELGHQPAVVAGRGSVGLEGSPCGRASARTHAAARRGGAPLGLHVEGLVHGGQQPLDALGVALLKGEVGACD